MQLSLQNLAYFLERYRELQGIARSLHRYYTLHCNGDLTPRQEKRESRLEDRAKEVIEEINRALGTNLDIHFQTDPRGLPLWIVDQECWQKYPHSDGKWLNYHRGIPVYLE